MSDVCNEPAVKTPPSSDAVELLYLWTECDESGFIQNQGFNFSPHYRFELKAGKDGKQYELSCVKDENYPKIWEVGNIVNLTAVVGENGSGKSSLLRHLLDPSEDHYRQHKLIKIYRCGRNIKVYHNFANAEIVVNTAFQIEKASLDEAPKQTRIFMTNSMDSAPIQKRHEQQDWAFFSPAENKERARMFFEKAGNADDLKKDGPFGLLQQLASTNRDFSDFDKFVTADYFHYLLRHEEEVQKATVERNESESVAPPSRMLSTCSQQITLVAQEPIISRKDLPSYLYHNFIPELYARIFKDFPEWNPNAALHPVDEICWAFIFELDFMIRAIHGPDGHAPNLDENLIKLDIDPLQLEEGMQKLLGLYQTMEKHNKAVLEYYQEAAEEIHELRIFWDQGKTVNVNANQANQFERKGMIIHRDQDPTLYRELCQHIHDWMRKETSFVLKYIGIRMTPLSSGEKAMQNLFSWLRLPPSFHEVLGQKSVPIADNILLLLDEIDLYMHPDWQRQFLHLLYKRLEQEYPGKYIQMIISTHSPLVLSDIPSHNIIYLQSGGEKCTIARGPETKESFGANLFTLLKDSFFLKQSMGEFAFSQISIIIKKLNKLKSKPEDTALREECREYDRLIGIIGEPVLRRKLQGLYREVFPANAGSEHERFMEEFNRLRFSDDPRDKEKYRQLFETMRASFDKD